MNRAISITIPFVDILEQLTDYMRSQSFLLWMQELSNAIHLRRQLPGWR